MKTTFISILILLLSYSAYSQDKYFTIEKVGGNKAYKIKVNAIITIESYKIINDSLKETHFVYSHIDKVSSDSILLDVGDTGIKTHLADKTSIYTYHDYPYGTSFKTSYNIHGIDYIQWENRSSRMLHDFGKGMSIVSAFFGLVVAPLVSIDYKEKSFNLNTYKTWVIGSFTPLCITIPITILTKPKEIKLRDHSEDKNPRWKAVEYK